jgi:hypothetical protein
LISWPQLNCFNKLMHRLTLASAANEANPARVIITKNQNATFP